MYLKELTKEYDRKKAQIQCRLEEFKNTYKSKKDKDMFSELCFCILTPQSKAVSCGKAIEDLRNSGLLFRGNRRTIKNKLKGVRFPNNKALYLLAARKSFKNGNCLDVKTRLDINNISKTRDWLVKNIKGLGYKEASHFLRNIGLGRDMAILDVHILKNLKRLGIIKTLPKNFSKAKYLSIENRLKEFSKKINIPMEELDLLFWSHETGFIFK